MIDDEIKLLLEESYARVTGLLKRSSTEHHRIAKALLKYETLNEDELRLVIAGKFNKEI